VQFSFNCADNNHKIDDPWSALSKGCYPEGPALWTPARGSIPWTGVPAPHRATPGGGPKRLLKASPAAWPPKEVKEFATPCGAWGRAPWQSIQRALPSGLPPGDSSPGPGFRPPTGQRPVEARRGPEGTRPRLGRKGGQGVCDSLRGMGQSPVAVYPEGPALWTPARGSIPWTWIAVLHRATPGGGPKGP
jgi:hypothetical protein